MTNGFEQLGAIPEDPVLSRGSAPRKHTTSYIIPRSPGDPGRNPGLCWMGRESLPLLDTHLARSPLGVITLTIINTWMCITGVGEILVATLVLMLVT